jgi:hypothetical protein
MPHQFEMSFPPHDPRHEKLKNIQKEPLDPPVLPKEDLKVAREEVAYGWREDVRDAVYTKLVGEKPKGSIDELQIADGILDPKAEQDRLWHENRNEDRNDITELYRRPKPGPTEE